jgi:hypothetical protein
MRFAPAIRPPPERPQRRYASRPRRSTAWRTNNDHLDGTADPQRFHARGAWREFWKHPSPWMIGATFVAPLITRTAVGDWQFTDAVVPLVMTALSPFYEWVIHVVILRWRPKHVGRVTVDPLLARKHPRPTGYCASTLIRLPLPSHRRRKLARQPGLAFLAPHDDRITDTDGVEIPRGVVRAEVDAAVAHIRVAL